MSSRSMPLPALSASLCKEETIMAYNFNEIKLEKGMYSERGRSFEQTLEALDPNENYKGTP